MELAIGPQQPPWHNNKDKRGMAIFIDGLTIPCVSIFFFSCLQPSPSPALILFRLWAFLHQLLLFIFPYLTQLRVDGIDVLKGAMHVNSDLDFKLSNRPLTDMCDSITTVGVY